jgi:16S rRNA processing protein RimM
MLLIVGQVTRPHGIRGEVVVDVRTDEPAQRFAPGSVLVTDPGRPAQGRAAPVTGPGRADGPGRAGAEAAVDGRWRVPETLTVEAARPHQGRLIVAFDGIHDRNLAEELRGVLLQVDSADLPAIEDPDEFSDHDLVGLLAVDADGQRLGEVVRIEHAPASELLVLRRPDGRDALVPFVKAIVPEVDLAGRRVVLAPPEGLFDL